MQGFRYWRVPVYAMLHFLSVLYDAPPVTGASHTYITPYWSSILNIIRPNNRVNRKQKTYEEYPKGKEINACIPKSCGNHME